MSDWAEVCTLVLISVWFLAYWVNDCKLVFVRKVTLT